MNCPHCDAIIYSRRSGSCGVCGEPLPAELLFSDEQKSKIEEELKSLERNHREAQANLDRLTNHSRGHRLL